MNESRIVALVTHLFVQTPKLGQPVDNCETRQDPRASCTYFYSPVWATPQALFWLCFAGFYIYALISRFSDFRFFNAYK